MAKAIILNGISSSGKTTLSKALQEELEGCWLHFKMDTFWDMVPDGVEAGSKSFPNMKVALMRSANALLDTGHNIIMDCVFTSYDKIGFAGLLHDLGEHGVFTVAVTVDLSLAEQREKIRGDRMIGLAKSQYENIHDNYDYDFVVDTTELSAKELANIIKGQLVWS